MVRIHFASQVGTTDAFVVGVSSLVFDEVSPEDRRGTLLVQGMAGEVTAAACHPFKTLLALACQNGTMQIWDYEMKLLMNLKEFNLSADPLGHKLSMASKQQRAVADSK